MTFIIDYVMNEMYCGIYKSRVEWSWFKADLNRWRASSRDRSTPYRSVSRPCYNSWVTNTRSECYWSRRCS